MDEIESVTIKTKAILHLSSTVLLKIKVGDSTSTSVQILANSKRGRSRNFRVILFFSTGERLEFLVLLVVIQRLFFAKLS